MKKTLLTMMMAVMALMAQAQTTHTFTDNLYVTVDDVEFLPEVATINVTEKTDDTYTLSLKNFCLGVIPVGTIRVDKIVPSVTGKVVKFNISRVIQIVAGDLPGVPEEEYLGPKLGDVPIVLSAAMQAEKLYCVIDIDMTNTELGQMIKVTFSEDFTTGVSSVSVEDGAALVDVYTLNGTLVRSDVARAQALDGLQKGIYVVGGRKVIK